MEEELQKILRDVADSLVAFYKLRAPVDTGALQKSIRAEVRPDGQIAIIYLRYGAYQDLGVQGWGTAKNYAPNSPFKFRNRPDTGYNNLRKWGIPPQYWVSNPDGVPIINQGAVDLLEAELADVIEQIVATTTERTAL